VLIIIAVYIAAALFNLRIPDTGVRYPPQQRDPVRLVRDFARYFTLLWSDKIGRISLAVTALLWGAAQTLQFIVLKWAESSLGLSLSQASILQAFVAVGVAIGAMTAAARIPLRRALDVLPIGVIIGASILVMAFISRDIGPPSLAFHVGNIRVPAYMVMTCILLAYIGAMSGFFVVPMNALLQHRGHVLLSAGHSIAVQNFSENLSILLMLSSYAILIWLNVTITAIIVFFSIFLVGVMSVIIQRHRTNHVYPVSSQAR